MSVAIEELTQSTPSLQETAEGMWFSVFYQNEFSYVNVINEWGDNMAVYDSEMRTERDEDRVLEVADILTEHLDENYNEDRIIEALESRADEVEAREVDNLQQEGN